MRSHTGGIAHVAEIIESDLSDREILIFTNPMSQRCRIWRPAPSLAALPIRLSGPRSFLAR